MLTDIALGFGIAVVLSAVCLFVGMWWDERHPRQMSPPIDTPPSLRDRLDTPDYYHWTGDEP